MHALRHAPLLGVARLRLVPAQACFGSTKSVPASSDEPTITLTPKLEEPAQTASAMPKRSHPIRLEERSAYQGLLDAAYGKESRPSEEDLDKSMQVLSKRNLNYLSMKELLSTRAALTALGKDADALVVRNVANSLLWRTRTARIGDLTTLAKAMSDECSSRGGAASDSEHLLSETVRSVERRWVEVEDVTTFTKVLSCANVYSPHFIAKVTDKMIEFVEVSPPSQVVAIMGALGDNYIRPLPLIKACVYALKKKTGQLTAKELARLLVASSRVSFKDAELLDEVMVTLATTAADELSTSTLNVLRSVVLSVGKLQLSKPALLPLLSKALLAKKEEVKERDVQALVSSAARLNQWTEEASQILQGSLDLSEQAISNDVLWIDLVWSLVHVGKHTEKVLSTVLSEEFIAKVEQLPDNVRMISQQKLLTINAVAKLLTPGYTGPFLSTKDNFFLHSSPANRADKQGVRARLADSFASVASPPKFAQVRPDVRMGFRADAVCVMETATAKPVQMTEEDIFREEFPEGQKKVAVLLCEYHDMLSGGAPSGLFDLKVRLLESSGFGVVVVRHDELVRGKLDNVKMLEGKVKAVLTK